MRRLTFTMLMLCAAVLTAWAGPAASPNKKLTVAQEGTQYVVRYQGKPVVTLATVGFETLPTEGKPKLRHTRHLQTDYTMLAGKRLHCENAAEEYCVTLNKQTELVIRLYNDGVAFRYELTGLNHQRVPKELTTYRIAEGTRRWMQDWKDSYEGFFPLTETGKGDKHRWGYPALTEPQQGVFALYTEANIERRQSASCLYNDRDVELYEVRPDRNEVEVEGAWHTPWRVVIVGSLADVVASTLVTDVSEPCKLRDTSWIEPGVVSWVYWAYNHGSNDFDIIQKYVDMAARLHLPYVLIDAEWDEMKDWKSIEDAVYYAREKGVKPLIWYNSTTGWIDGAPGPKYRLNKAEDREREFAWCERLGVAGVKIDFFAGDTQETMDYCIDLLECAARHHLTVNFHGATIPRGWQRTYPHLMSTEGVYGAEWYNNVPTFTTRAARHNATLPFTRNVIGPMDYTPCAFSDSQHPHITSKAHELALTVLYESALQHLADKPESYYAQPKEVQDFFGMLPTVWDETRLVTGYPGEEVVMARRSGKAWYIAGINGRDEEVELTLSLDFCKNVQEVKLFADKGTEWDITTTNSLPSRVKLQARGGFVAVARELPYKDPNLSATERAKDLCGRLTLEEKAQLMLDESPAIPRLGIKKFFWWSEALHGAANMGNVTVFPEPVGMAASFNPDLLYKVFDATSTEFRAQYNHRMLNGGEDEKFHSLSVWTPNVNIFRDPRWGRGQETYGEDPYLTSQMGCAAVRGLQGPEDSKYRKLWACAKHYAVHSGPEYTRHSANLIDIEPRDLWETYLPAFKTLVQDAKVREVMCAYQRLDDEPCCGNARLLQQILRDEWGFKYLVVSDCGAVSDFYTSHKSSSDAVHGSAKAVISGTDVECGYAYAYRSIPEAVRRGLLSEQEVDKHVIRLLEGRFDLGEMDDPKLVSWSQIPYSVMDSKPHRQLSLDMARQSIVLLQNKGNVLPLAKNKEKIAVIGPNADDEPLMWGNYNGTPNHTVTILDGIKAKQRKIIHIDGCDRTYDKVMECLMATQCTQNGRKGLRGTFWNNTKMEGQPVTTQYYTTPLAVTTAGMHNFAPGVNLEDFSAKYETTFTPTTSGEYVINVEGCGDFGLYIDGERKMHHHTWRTTPTRTAIQAEAGHSYNIEVRFQYVKTWGANMKIDIAKEHPIDYAAVIQQLNDVQTVVFVGGISAGLEGEEMPVSIEGFKGGDRTSIELPKVQRNFLRALKEAGKTVIFVNCSGSAMALQPETETCDAIIQAWYPGQEGGTAVADILFGDCNPSGKLPITFYKNTEQLPDYEDYSMKGRTYRYFDDALFPFGYGLSYTTFKVGTAQLNLKKDGTGDITIPITNTGSRDGEETLQVYIRNTADPDAPLKTLRAFQRIDVKAGATENAVLMLTPQSFEFFDPESNTMRTLPGKYEILYGTSSRNQDLQTINFTIKD